MRTMVVIAAAAAALVAGGSGAASPKGTIAYTAGKRLFAAQLDGSAARLLTTLPAPALGGAWSSDGRRLAVGLRGGGVLVVDATRHRAVRLEGTALQHAWSASGDLLVTNGTAPVDVRSCSAKHQLRVLVYRADGSLVRRAHPLDAAEVAAQEPDDVQVLTSVAWSPGGRRLAYVATADDCAEASAGLGTSAIGVLDVATGAHHVLYRTRNWTYIGPPAWSRDGTHVAFAAGCNSGGLNGEGCNRVVDATEAGTALRAFGTAELIDDSVAWTPDGRIVFGTSRDNGRTRIGLRLLDPASGRGTWLVRGSRFGGFVDPVLPFFELSNDGEELIASTDDWLHTALAVTDLATAQSWYFTFRPTTLAVHADGIH